MHKIDSKLKFAKVFAREEIVFLKFAKPYAVNFAIFDLAKLSARETFCSAPCIAVKMMLSS